MSAREVPILDRVAKAIHAVYDEPEHTGGWDAMSEEWRDALREYARAALLAAREPTEAMILARLRGLGRNPGDEWRFMIDAALSPLPTMEAGR